MPPPLFLTYFIPSLPSLNDDLTFKLTPLLGVFSLLKRLPIEIHSSIPSKIIYETPAIHQDYVGHLKYLRIEGLQGLESAHISLTI